MTTANAVKEAIKPPIRWMRPSPSELARWANQCLASGVEPTLSAHAARDRLQQRGFCYQDVLDIIQRGYPYRVDPGSEPTEWKVNIAMQTKNGRDAAVVCLVSPKTKNVTVLTVMWVDRSYLKA